MAILSHVPGVTVTIVSYGRVLQEFDDPQYSDGRTVIKYIEAKTNAEFSIKIVVDQDAKFASSNSCMLFDVIVDGQMIAKRLIASDVPPVDRWQLVHGKTEVSMVYPMRFTHLDIIKSESSGLSEEAEQAWEVGEIRVETRYGKRKRPSDPPNLTGGLPPFYNVQSISDSALNGRPISHSIT